MRSRLARPRALPTDPLWRESIADAMVCREPRTPAGQAPAVPMTSAVRAGWVCVSLGLAVAWFFPFAQFFFSVGLILAIVAMATHQVRAGLLLLAGAFGGSALCAVVFLSGVLVVLGGLFSPDHQRGNGARTVFETAPPRLFAPVTPSRIRIPVTPADRLVASPEYPTAAARPTRLEDVRLMLRTGLSDAEIITAVSDRRFVGSMGPAEAADLRALGAGDLLLGYLGGSSTEPSPRAPDRVVVATAPVPVAHVALVAPLPLPTAASPPVDYAARDRRIESLKQQINDLDDQIRTVRTNPRDYRYPGYYAGSGGINQPSLQKYLDQLDQRRNALRREKWQLEGR